MFRRVLTFAIAALVPVCTLLADFSYEQTSTITGGAMMAMMRVAGAFSKQAREPIKTTILVKGNRMVHLSANRASVIDLDKETITEIDFQKKQYSVMTFAEMKQFLDEMSQKMKSNDGQAAFNVSAKATGNTRKIDGLDAKEMVITMEMKTSDPRSGQAGTMTITTDSWLAGGISGYSEVRDFQKRMGEKLAWTPGGGMMMSRPDMAKGMAEVYNEMAKLDGIPVLQLVKMGGAQPGAAGQNAQLTPEQQAQVAQSQQQADQARAQAAQQQQQQQQQQPSAGGVLGSALGGRLGRFGGLGRKKQPQQEPTQQPQPAQSEPAATSAPPAQPSDPAALMEMTIQLTNFSAGPVDSSKFDVPGGFKQVEPAMKGRH